MTHSPLTKLAALLFAVLSTLAYAQDLGWYNDKSSPYSISSATELGELRTLVNDGTDDFDGKTILLAEDIALSGNWTPIGNNSRPFQGVFDGQGHTISNLQVNGGNYAGLFGYVGANGQIKNINVIATTIATGTSGRVYAGGLAGYYASAKPIENSSVKATSIRASNTGTIGNKGIDGNGSGTGGNGSAGGNSDSSFSGGLVGYASVAFTITKSYTSVNVYSGSIGGAGGAGGEGDPQGFTGYKGGNGGNGGNAERSYSGGLVGYAFAVTVINSYANGDVSGEAGGGAGGDGGNGGHGLKTASCTPGGGGNGGRGGNGNASYIGGLVGYVNGASTITKSYASGTISGKSDAGAGGHYGNGGVGYDQYGDLGYCNANPKFGADGYTGTNGSAGNSYAGGILGRYASGTITSVYYKQGGASSAAGTGNPTGISVLSDANMKKQASFITWDFDTVWDIEENTDYPYFLIGTKLSTCTVSDIQEQPYSGEQIKPAISVSCDGKTLNLTTDYTISYGANINAGENSGSVTLTGKDDYKGSVTKNFTINKKALTVTGAAAEDKTYDGTTAAVITGAELSGIIGTDAVSLAGHTAGTFASANVGENIAISTSMSLTGTAAANYSITQPSDLKASITPKALAYDAIQAIAAQTYSGSAITPEITVKDGSKTLENGIDYTLLVSNNRNVGTAIVRATGMGNYAGIADATFTIQSKSLANSMIQPISQQLHTGSPIEPEVIVKDGTRYLVEGTDYTISYSSNEAPGFGLVTITGMGNYTGNATANFVISGPKHIEDLEILPVSNQIYTGSPITPTPIIKDGSYDLIEGTDYTIDGYTSNVNIGTSLIRVTGIGLYFGTTNIAFTIVAQTVSSSSSDTPSSSSVLSSSSVTPSSSSATPSSSSGTVTPSSSSTTQPSSSSLEQPNITRIDNFANLDSLSRTLEPWGAYTDKGDNGASTIDNINTGATNNYSDYIVVMQDGADYVAKIINYRLSKGSNPYDPYTALQLTAEKNGTSYDLSKCTDGLRYSYKGAAHNFNVGLSTISDYGYYSLSSTASTAWRTVTVPFTALKQPNWAAKVTFDAKKINLFTWEVKGDISTATGELSIKDFYCLGNMPLPSSTPIIRLPQIAASSQATLIRNGISLHATSKAVVEVYGLNGNLVSRQNFGSGVYAVSYGHLPKGVYIVKAEFGSEKQILRLPVR